MEEEVEEEMLVEGVEKRGRVLRWVKGCGGNRGENRGDGRWRDKEREELHNFNICF